MKAKMLFTLTIPKRLADLRLGVISIRSQKKKEGSGGEKNDGVEKKF
jgi:hypothetical protein